MDSLIVTGPSELSGNVRVSSAKNAALPILAATILFPQKINFRELPKISDINFFIKILESLNSTSTDGELVCINTSGIDKVEADYELVRKMRASVLVLGPLLSRFKEAKVSLPGGCAIGSRPVDIHLSGLEKMGAEIEIDGGYINAKTEGLKGAHIDLAFPSVGATENLMMAAVWAEGETVIDNAAREPEIVDLANFLMQFGTQIHGEGTSTITIQGRDITKYKIVEDNEYKIIGDRIEAATYIIAGLMTNSQITVTNFKPDHIGAVLDVLKTMGAKLEIGENSITTLKSERLNGTNFETAPFPGFPTDVQAQLMALMGVSKGNSIISEHIFENRYMHVPELVRMGMNIKLDGHSAVITGVEETSPAPVMCTDLRASAALILSAMLAEGETTISRVYHLDRGYENIEEKLQGLGAKIRRIKA